MKKLTLALAVSAIAASSVHAGSIAVTGNLGNWKSFNASSKAPLPYFVAAAGVNLVQANNAGDNITTTPGAINIAVNGTATYDDVTGAVTSLNLSQIGSYTGWYDTDGDLIADDYLTFTDLQWNYAGGMMSQVAGTASGCTSSSPVCAFTRDSMFATCLAVDCGSTHSVFDFSGITAGFKTLPRSNSTFSGYGTFSYKTWAATAGASTIANLDVVNWPASQARTINVASMVNSGTVTINAANIAQFNLEFVTVPVPAAAWLMGSGLIGLAGIKRRRK